MRYTKRLALFALIVFGVALIAVSAGQKAAPAANSPKSRIFLGPRRSIRIPPMIPNRGPMTTILTANPAVTWARLQPNSWIIGSNMAVKP